MNMKRNKELYAAFEEHVNKCTPNRRLEAELELRIAIEAAQCLLKAGYLITVL
jgi:hypothetical protein